MTAEASAGVQQTLNQENEVTIQWVEEEGGSVEMVTTERRRFNRVPDLLRDTKLREFWGYTKVIGGIAVAAYGGLDAIVQMTNSGKFEEVAPGATLFATGIVLMGDAMYRSGELNTMLAAVSNIRRDISYILPNHTPPASAEDSQN